MSVIGVVVRRVTGWWPRSEAERFADAMFPDLPALGDDSFAIADVDMRHVPEGDGCICFWTDPSTWTTHYGAVEPGSQMEWNPECPVHLPDDCSPAAGPAGVSPAGERIPRPMPPAGHSTELAQLIADVLVRYVEDIGPLDSYFRIDDVAKGIAHRIGRATPPAPFTFGDLSKAAAVLSRIADGWPVFGDEHRELRALANRLADGADADPNP